MSKQSCCDPFILKVGPSAGPTLFMEALQVPRGFGTLALLPLRTLRTPLLGSCLAGATAERPPRLSHACFQIPSLDGGWVGESSGLGFQRLKINRALL